MAWYAATRVVEIRKELNYKRDCLIDKQIFHGLTLYEKTKITYFRSSGCLLSDKSKIMGRRVSDTAGPYFQRCSYCTRCVYLPCLVKGMG